MSEANDTGVTVDWLGGNCPVQAEGHVDGEPFYFRSRGERWSFSVGGEVIGSPAFYYEEPYGTWPDAGWITEEEAQAFIAKGVGLYRQSLVDASARETVDG